MSLALLLGACSSDKEASTYEFSSTFEASNENENELIEAFETSNWSYLNEKKSDFKYVENVSKMIKPDDLLGEWANVGKEEAVVQLESQLSYWAERDMTDFKTTVSRENDEYVIVAKSISQTQTNSDAGKAILEKIPGASSSTSDVGGLFGQSMNSSSSDDEEVTPEYIDYVRTTTIKFNNKLEITEFTEEQYYDKPSETTILFAYKAE